MPDCSLTGSRLDSTRAYVKACCRAGLDRWVTLLIRAGSGRVSAIFEPFEQNRVRAKTGASRAPLANLQIANGRTVAAFPRAATASVAADLVAASDEAEASES